MTNEAKAAYDTLTRASSTRAYIPAAEIGNVATLGELAGLGLIATVVRGGTLHVIRTRASQSL